MTNEVCCNNTSVVEIPDLEEFIDECKDGTKLRLYCRKYRRLSTTADQALFVLILPVRQIF